jgi:hypothetical protein
VSDFNFVSGKVRRVGAFVSGQVDSMGAFVSGKVESVGRATFPVFVPPAIVFPAWLTDIWLTDTIVGAQGDPISPWSPDRGSVDFVAPGAANRPVLILNDGLPHLLFDTINDLMDAAINSPQPNTIIVVADPVIGTTRFWIDGVAGRNAIYGTGEHQIFAGAAERLTGVAVATGIQMTGAVFNGASSRFRKNSTDNALASPGTAASNPLRIGRNLGAGDSGYAGKLYAVMMAQGYAATVGDLNDLQAVCQAKWGTP